MNLDNSINVNDQETNTNQILLNVGSHATNNDNMLKKPVGKTYANSEKNNKQLAIDYYSIDYVSRQPMKEVFTDLEYKRKHSKNNQTKQIRKVQEIVQGNNSISLTNLIKTKNDNYASKRTDISYPKPKTTSNIQTTITVTKRHPLEQLKTVIHEIKMNVDFNNNNLQSNNQISTNKDFRGINGNKTIPSDLRYHHDLVQQLPVTTRNEKSRTSIEQSGKRTFKRKSVDGINMNIRNSRKESLELSERNNLSTNKVTVPKSVSKLIDNKSIAQDFQNRLHFQQLKRDKYNAGLQPIQSNIPYRKERHPKSNTNNTERITNTKSIKLSERIHQVRTDNPPPISISQISSDKFGNQIPLQETLSTRKYNHRLKLARNKPRQISVDKSNYVNNTEGSIRTKPTDLLKRRNHVIHDTLPQLITQRDSGIESVSNIENSENQQNTESDLSKHLKMNVKQSDFPQTKTKLHGHMNLYPQKLESNFISSKKMTGNVQQSTHPTLNWQNNLTKGVLTRSTNKELLKTPVKNLQTQSVEKLDEQKRIQQKTKRKTIFSLQHFGTSIKKPSEKSSTQSVDTNIYDIQAESEITNPVNPNVSKTHLQKKDSSKDKLEIQAEDNNSDYYYYEDDDATTDVLVLELPAEETISENKATENNFQKSSNSNKNVEPDINENSEYYDYDSYSESFEDNGALSKTKSTVKILTESNKDQSRHTDAFHNVNPVKNLNSEQSQKNQINSHIDGEFSDYTESDDYSDSNYDDSAEVTANDKGQLNNRIVNPQSPKTIDNEGPDFYYDDSLLSEEKDNGEDYYYDSGDSDIYYDESDLSNKRQIATTSKQMIKRKTITESEVGKTMPSNLVKAYERIRKLCLCNSVNGRTTSDILMQRYA
ncbi:unnamed protein product [Mytilus coruscus]|uniref:Uncharacterized protein n=1 Tax=Mytilus coruscus TaxID=42192 RepID=A0A6J7ZXR9_MYTCO|nr:unnamed protein product [Mytilus coruscus]